MATISVIIPSFNRAVLLERAITSVLAQSRLADEIIVINDGSTDNTATLLPERYPEIKFIHQQHCGVSAARNAGITAASGDWIALLDSDDIWHHNKLERQQQAVNNTPQHLICHSDEFWVSHGKRVNPMKKHRKTGGDIFQHCLGMCVISPSTVMIHRSLFDEMGLFDETLPACEDYDLWLRFCSRYQVLYVNEALITKYGGHADQLSRQYWGMDRFRIRSLSRIIADPCLHKAQREAAIKTMTEKIHIYLNGATKHGNTEYVDECQLLLAQYADHSVAV